MTRPEYTPNVQRLAELARRLKLVSDPTRAHLLLLLGDGKGYFDVLGAETGCTRAALTRDLILLRTAGLAESRQDSHWKVYSLTDAGRDLVRILTRVAALPSPPQPAL